MSQHLAFMESQASHIETMVYQRKYADIQYPSIVPIDVSANEFSDSVTHYSEDATGEARFMATEWTDIPIVDTSRSQHSVRIMDLGIGYSYTMKEIGRAMLLGENLDSTRAMHARFVMEKKIDDIVLNGYSDLQWDGLMDSPLIPRYKAVNGGSGSSEWTSKDPTEVISDITDMLSGLWQDSNTVEMANTILLPPKAYSYLVHTPYRDTTLYNWISQYNIYSATTGSPLMMRVVRGLNTAGHDGATDSGGTNTGARGTTTSRAIAYRRDMEVLKLHMPKPLTFEPVQQWLNKYIVFGLACIGGLEIRVPGAIRYLDGIMS